VCDNKEGFEFGESVLVGQADMGSEIMAFVMDTIPPTERMVVVGHTVEGDKRWLMSIGVDLDPAVGSTCDVAMVEQAVTNQQERRKLEKLCVKYAVQTMGSQFVFVLGGL
jgi:hypothetical protein